MSKKSDAKYATAMMRRIAKAEADTNATILRAFDRMLRLLEREKTEWLIKMDRRERMKPKRSAAETNEYAADKKKHPENHCLWSRAQSATETR